MARLSFKPDASFFRKIVTGAVGSRAVCEHLSTLGHEMIELERGSTDTKMWKEVKRKRVRIPDLVCVKCGLRVESRAKTKIELSMSHSPTEEERAWDYGMVDNDVIAFPVSTVENEEFWSTGKLNHGSSYWSERNSLEWKSSGYINYFYVQAFRKVKPSSTSTKGVTEGSETSIKWDAIFSTKKGIVTLPEGRKIKVTPAPESKDRPYTWQNKEDLPIVVEKGQEVEVSQVLASHVTPIKHEDMRCQNDISPDYIKELLASPERTERYTGVKLARVRGERELEKFIYSIMENKKQDIYIRLEAVAYLGSVCGYSVKDLIQPFLNSTDQQIQLESVITLGETGTSEAVDVLSDILNNYNEDDEKYFLCSAAAWSLSKIGTEIAIRRLIDAFSCINPRLREEALEGIKLLGEQAVPNLLESISTTDDDIAAGCAEALRQLENLSVSSVEELVDKLQVAEETKWIVWLLGHLSRDDIEESVSKLQKSRPELYYAITVLWSFMESWIAKHWEI